MIKRTLLIIFTITILNTFSFGQQNYFYTDSLNSSGISIVDGGSRRNSQQFELKEGEKTVIYSPGVVKEYGFKDGRVYVARKINFGDTLKWVFLERLVKGKINLYFYQGAREKKFFLEKNNLNMVELLKTDSSKENFTFRDLLKDYTKGCDHIIEPIKLVNYDRTSLTILIKRYNLCQDKPFPFTKYGIILGYGVNTIIQNSHISDASLKNAVFSKDNSILVGVFLDYPILNSYFSFHPEVLYQKNSFSSHTVSLNAIVDYAINIHSLTVPLLFRYTLPSHKIRPFIDLGPSINYNFKNENKIYSMDVINGVIELDNLKVQNQIIIPETQYGYSFGGGVQYKINYKNSISFELRYNNYGKTKEELGVNRIEFLTGLNF